MKFFAASIAILSTSLSNAVAEECCALPSGLGITTCPSGLIPIVDNTTLPINYIMLDALVCCSTPDAIYAIDIILLCTYFDRVNNLPPKRSVRKLSDLPPHITETGAYELWEKGIKGEGILIGLAGGGVNVRHEALTEGYLGYNEDGTFTHDYAWLEPLPFAGLNFSHDEFNVGTHMTSIMVGRTQNVGIAPAAQYIHCKVLDANQFNDPNVYNMCLEWFLQPKPQNKPFNASLSKIPDIVVLPPCGSCSDSYILQEKTDALVKAGVIVVSGSGDRSTAHCASIAFPPATYQGVVTVTALNDTGAIYNTSSLGPALVNGSVTEYIKPDGTVLGHSVVGAVWLNFTNYYFPASGSAVASTVFAGSLALLLNALPCLRRQPEKVMELLHMSLEPINSIGCYSSTSYPNNVYGYGKINVTQTVDFFLVSEDFKCERERCECIWVGSNDPIKHTSPPPKYEKSSKCAKASVSDCAFQ